MSDNKILEVRNKKYGLALSNIGFEIIDLKKCYDGIHYIFQYSDEILATFKQLIAENSKRRYLLTDRDVMILVGYLEGYDLEDKDRFRLLSVFDKFIDRVGNEESNTKESIDVVDISQLKKSMNSGKG